MNPRHVAIVCACWFGAAASPGRATPLDDRVRAFAQAQSTPSEEQVSALLSVGIAEQRSAEALAAVQPWLSSNPPAQPQTMLYAGQACESSGQWLAAIGHYQRLLQTPNVDSNVAGPAVDALYRLLLGSLQDFDAAYQFMRKEGNAVRAFGRARRYDRWFLDQARQRRDLLALSERLAVLVNDQAVKPEEIDLDLRWLCEQLEQFQKEGADVYESALRLAALPRTPPLEAARVRWVATVMPYNFRLDLLRSSNTPADPKLTDAPLAAAEQLLRLDPDRGALTVAAGWGVEYDHIHSGHCAERFKVEGQRKRDQLLATLPRMSPQKRDDLLAFPIAQGRMRFDAATVRAGALQFPGMFNSLAAAQAPLVDKATMTVEDAKALAPQLARCPHPDAAIIRAIAASHSLEFSAMAQAMLQSELWRFNKTETAIDLAWNSSTTQAQKPREFKERHAQPQARSQELANQLTKNADSPQSLAAFKAIHDDLLSQAPTIPAVMTLWDQFFAKAPDATVLSALVSMMADLSGDREYLLRRALEIASFAGPNKLSWAANPHETYFRHNRPNVLKVLADQIVPIQGILEKQAQAGAISEVVFGVWLQSVDPKRKDAQAFIQTLIASPAYRKLDPAYHKAVADGNHFGSLIQIGDSVRNEPRWVSRELLSLPGDASPEAVLAAFEAVLQRTADASEPVPILGLEPVAKLPQWTPEVRRLVLSLFREHRPIGDPPARQGYEPLLVRLCTELSQQQQWGEVEPCLSGLWQAASATDDGRYFRGVAALIDLAESALNGGAKSVALAVTRSGSVSRAVRSFAAGNDAGLTQLNGRVTRVMGKASIALGIIDIPVDERDPAYAIFKSQSEFAVGNTEAAWELYDKNADRLGPVLRRLTVPYCLWLLERNIEAQQSERAESLIRALTVWSREAAGTFTPSQDAELKLAYADAALQKGELQTAKAWYRRIADAQEYKRTPLEYRARLSAVSVDRAAKDYASALEELDKLMLIRDEELRQRVHYAKAEVLFDQQKYPEAFEEVATVLRHDAGHADALILMGKVQLEMRKLVDASEIELGVTRDQSVIVPGETIKINLTDPGLNISGVTADIEVEVRSKSGDVERVMLYQFGDDKTRFRAEVPTQLGARQAGDKVLQVLGRDEVRYGYSRQFREKMKDLPKDPDTVITIASDAGLQATAGAFPPRQGERRLDLAELGVSSAQQALGTRSVRPGNPIYVRVNDPDQGKTDQPDQIIVSVQASSGDAVPRFALTETGAHTGEFQATVATGSAQALAYASEAAPGREANMVISAKPYPGWAGDVGSKAAEQMFVVDLNDDVPLDTMTVLCPDSTQVLTRLVVQSSMNGRDWTTRARFPAAPAPWDGRPQITAFPTYNRGIPVSTPKDRQPPEDWVYTMEIASARAAVPFGEAVVTGLSKMNLERNLPDGGHPEYSVLMRYRALFYQPAAAVRTFRLDGPPGDAGTIFLIDGVPAAKDAQDPLTIERELKPGLHEVQFWRHDRRVTLTKLQPVLLCDVQGQEALAPCPEEMFNPETFPPGVRQAVPSATIVTAADAANTQLDIAFGENTHARMVRLVILDHKGPAPTIGKINLTDRNGIKRLPVAFDYQELRTNEQLEVLPGDTVTIRYDDDLTVTPRRGVQQAQLTVAFNTATLNATFLNYITTEEGRQLVMEPIRRFKMDDSVGIVIHDPDMDVGPDADRVSFTVRSSDGSTATLQALETGPHTGEFLGRVFPMTSQPLRDEDIQVPHGGTLTAVYRDEENLDPGIPADRTVTLEHARYATPALVVYDVTTRPLEPQGAKTPASPKPDQSDRGQEVVAPRRVLDYHAPGKPEAGAAASRLVVGASLRFDVVAPHLAFASSSKIVAYVQTESGRRASETGPNDAKDSPAGPAGAFDVRVPGTLRIEAQPSRSAEQVAPPGYVIGTVGVPTSKLPALDEGRFAFTVPVALDDLPTRSFATDDAAELAASMRPEALAVSPGDRVYIGFAYLDEQGQPRWLTAAADLQGHQFLDMTDDRYRTTIRSAYVGEKLYIRLIAPLLDRGPERDVASVQLTTDSGVSAPYELRESERHSGVFKGSFKLGYADAPAGGALPSVVLHGLPVKYGDRVTVSVPETGPDAPPPATVAINLGADGLIEPFSKRYGEDSVAIQTTFTLAECYFELAKHHRAMDQESLARREMAHAQKMLAEAIESHRDPQMQAHAQYLLGNLAQEYADLSKNEDSRKQMYQDALARFARIPVDYPETEFAPKAQFKKGLVYEKLGEVNIAVEEYVKLAYTYPDHELIPSVMSRLGAYFQDQGQALKAQSEAIQKPEGDTELQGEALRLMELARQQYLNAARVFKKLQDRFPTDPLAGLAGLRSAQNYMRAGDFAQAIAGFQKVYDTQEYDDKTIRSQAMYWAGISNERLGQLQQAYQLYRRTTFDFPDSVWAKQSRGRLADPAFAKIIAEEQTERQRMLESLKEQGRKR